MNVEKMKDRIKKLCVERGISQTTAFIKSGVGKNFLSNLPSVSKKNLALLAKYFGVSVEYLTGEEDEELFARRIIDSVVEWLQDSGYEYERTDSEAIISKNGTMLNLAYGDFMNECLRIKKASENGFELAMENWERVHFMPKKSNHHLFNTINESPNATLNIAENNGFSKQELELIETYRSLDIKGQADFINYLLDLKK